MNTAINAEVYHQLSLIEDNENCMRNILTYLNNMLPKWNISTSRAQGAEYSRLIKQLSDYQEYEYDWDGDGALPLEKQSVKNFKAVLSDAEDNLLKGWWISPEKNGTILMVSGNGNSNIQIGNSTISYFIKHSDGTLEGESSIKFSAKKVVSVMEKNI